MSEAMAESNVVERRGFYLGPGNWVKWLTLAELQLDSGVRATDDPRKYALSMWKKGVARAKCEKHNEEIVPVSWMKRNGIAYSTTYACQSCIKEANERKAPIQVFEGPVDHSADDDDSPYKIMEILRRVTSDEIAMMVVVDFEGGIQVIGRKAVHALTFPECIQAGEKLLDMKGLVKALRFWADKLEIPDLSAKIGVEYKGE